jgi:hypothetical protein
MLYAPYRTVGLVLRRDDHEGACMGAAQVQLQFVEEGKLFLNWTLARLLIHDDAVMTLLAPGASDNITHLRHRVRKLIFPFSCCTVPYRVPWKATVDPANHAQNSEPAFTFFPRSPSPATNGTEFRHGTVPVPAHNIFFGSTLFSVEFADAHARSCLAAAAPLQAATTTPPIAPTLVRHVGLDVETESAPIVAIRYNT